MNVYHPSLTSILNKLYLLASQLHQQPVGHKLDVLLHERPVHSDECTGKGVRQELLLNTHCVDDYLRDALLRRLVHDVAEHEAGKVTVETLDGKDM